MRNRAKCRLCQQIIESLHYQDYVMCSCNEIAVDGGANCFKAFAKDFKNFLRVDDEDNEINVTVVDDVPSQPIDMPNTKPNKKELRDMLHEMIKSYENLPPHALSSPVTHSDLHSVLLLMAALFSED